MLLLGFGSDRFKLVLSLSKREHRVGQRSSAGVNGYVAWLLPTLERRRILFLAIGANPLNQQVCFLTLISIGQRNGWNPHLIEAGSLATLMALEVNMIVVMIVFAATMPAERVFGIARIVEHPMHDTFIQKSPERAVDRHPVVVGPQARLNITVRQRVIALHEQIEQFYPIGCMAEVVFLKRLCSGHRRNVIKRRWH